MLSCWESCLEIFFSKLNITVLGFEPNTWSIGVVEMEMMKEG